MIHHISCIAGDFRCGFGYGTISDVSVGVVGCRPLSGKRSADPVGAVMVAEA
jgi:hypothetical protein